MHHVSCILCFCISPVVVCVELDSNVLHFCVLFLFFLYWYLFEMKIIENWKIELGKICTTLILAPTSLKRLGYEGAEIAKHKIAMFVVTLPVHQLIIVNFACMVFKSYKCLLRMCGCVAYECVYAVYAFVCALLCIQLDSGWVCGGGTSYDQVWSDVVAAYVASYAPDAFKSEYLCTIHCWLPAGNIVFSL